MNYTSLPSQDIIDITIAGLTERGIHVQFVQNKVQALEALKKTIPAGSEILTASSTTLNQIGFTDLLKSGQHSWKNLGEEITKEPDPAKRAQLRKEAVVSEYTIGSVNAMTQAGQLINASASGSQIPGYAFTAQNVVWVVGVNKIAPTLETAMQRIREYVVPLEDQRMKDANMGGTVLAKWFIFEREPSFMGRTIHLILVNELLGF